MAHRHTGRGVRVSAQPLLDAVALRSRARGESIAPYGTAEGRAIDRAKADGHLDYFAADRLAIRLLGTHPALLWGAEWNEAGTLLDTRRTKTDALHLPHRSADREPERRPTQRRVAEVPHVQP